MAMINFNGLMFAHGPGSPVAAGESTLREYESLRKAWVARNRRFFRTLDVITGLVVVVSVVVWRLLPWSGWYAGLVAGMVLSLDISVRMNPPAWIEQWGAGGVGEQRTGRALDALSQRWSVIHDWQLPGRGNVDHVVIGPARVSAVETKNIGTPVRIDGDTLTASRPDGRGRYATTAPVGQARGNAAALSRELGAGLACGAGSARSWWCGASSVNASSKATASPPGTVIT